MPLHYDWTDTPNHEQLSDTLKYTATMATMALGVGDLSTAKGFAEYALRLSAYEAWFGALLLTPDGDPIGLSAFVEQVRGLRTNVTLEPRAKWFKRMSDTFIKERFASASR